MMNTDKFVICVTYTGDGVFIDIPEKFVHHLDGCFCEDNNFNGVTKEPGMYECEAEFLFDQGYSDGFPADGESDWEWRVVSHKTLYSLPIGHRDDRTT